MNDALLMLLERLAQVGRENDACQSERAKRMLNITPDTGRLLWILAINMRATRILEVGTSNAFSTIWLADAARSNGGRVTTLELNPAKIALARTNLAAAGLDGVVDIVEGRAIDTLVSLPRPFDMIFLDADRPNYVAFLDIVVPKLRTGGLLIADNATSHADEMQDYIARVNSHPQLFAVTVPIGNGEHIAIKLSGGGDKNAILAIHPYKWEGVWVFDDPRVGLVQEPFVAGADVVIDRMVEGIANAEAGVTIFFSVGPFPGSQHEFQWRREESGGNWYYSPEYDLEGWLCPALFKYFDEAPQRLYAQVKAKGG